MKAVQIPRKIQSILNCIYLLGFCSGLSNTNTMTDIFFLTIAIHSAVYIVQSHLKWKFLTAHF